MQFIISIFYRVFHNSKSESSWDTSIRIFLGWPFSPQQNYFVDKKKCHKRLLPSDGVRPDNACLHDPRERAEDPRGARYDSPEMRLCLISSSDETERTQGVGSHVLKKRTIMESWSTRSTLQHRNIVTVTPQAMHLLPLPHAESYEHQPSPLCLRNQQSRIRKGA